MVTINSFTQYRQIGALLLSKMGRDQNDDELLARNETDTKFHKDFDRIAALDGNPTTISYGDILTAEGYTIGQDLAKRLDEMKTAPGKYYVTDQIVGSSAEVTTTFAQLIKSKPIYLGFYKDLYEGAHSNFKPAALFMVPIEYADQAERLAKAQLEEFLSTFGDLTADRALDFVSDFRSMTSLYEIENEWNTWSQHVLVERKDIKEYQDKLYILPWPTSGIHELRHVAQMPRHYSSAKDILCNERTAAEELMNTTEQIVRNDRIMKVLMSSPDQSPIAYPLNIQTPSGKIALGEFAIKMRSMMQKYGDSASALMSDEFHDFLKVYYPPMYIQQNISDLRDVSSECQRAQ